MPVVGEGGMSKPPILHCGIVGGTGGGLSNKLAITSEGRMPCSTKSCQTL